MDVLSNVLAGIHISGSLLAYFRYGGEWGMDLSAGDGFTPADGIPFHHVVEGGCWLIGGGQPRFLQAGDLVLLPGWSPHALASRPEADLVTIYEVLDEQGYPRWRPGTTLERPLTFLKEENADNCVTILSGVFSLSGPGTAQLLAPLPRFMALRADDPVLNPQIKNTLEFVLSETRAPMPGYVAVASRLMDLLFIQLIRMVSMEFSLSPGLLNAIGHPQIAQILAAIHRDPQHSWTLDSMAEIGGLSRTTMVKTFSEVVGTTPVSYLTRWRMHLAESALISNTRRVSEIARSVGYPIPQCFSRAFKKVTGLSPVEYRERYQAEPP